MSYLGAVIDMSIKYNLILQMGERMNYFLFQVALQILANRSLLWQQRKHNAMEFVHGPLRSYTSAKIGYITFFFLMD